MARRRLRERSEWTFFGVLPKASPVLAVVWWVALVLRGVLPAVFAVAMGVLVGAARKWKQPHTATDIRRRVFVLLQVLTPIHRR